VERGHWVKDDTCSIFNNHMGEKDKGPVLPAKEIPAEQNNSFELL